MLHELPEVKAVQQKLKELCFDFAILGGYPRDLAHGVQPKDLDICIFNYHPSDIAEQLFTKNLIEWLYEQNLVDEVFSSSASAAQDSNVNFVIKLKYGMDLIFWNECCKDEWDVVRRFDFNINQYILRDGKPEYMGRLRMQLEALPLTECMTKDRQDHIVEKAKQLGWEIGTLHEVPNYLPIRT